MREFKYDLLVYIMPDMVALAIIFFGMICGVMFLNSAGLLIGFVIGIAIALPVSSAICVKMDDLF